MADSPLRRAHQEWIGNVRPEGLLVSGDPIDRQFRQTAIKLDAATEKKIGIEDPEQ